MQRRRGGGPPRATLVDTHARGLPFSSSAQLLAKHIPGNQQQHENKQRTHPSFSGWHVAEDAARKQATTHVCSPVSAWHIAEDARYHVASTDQRRFMLHRTQETTVGTKHASAHAQEIGAF